MSNMKFPPPPELARPVPNELRDTNTFGWEYVLDMVNCDVSTFTTSIIDKFTTDLCRLTKMQKCDIHFWQDQEGDGTPEHLKGISCVCFILTSSIVIHTLSATKELYLNFFSCKEFHYGDVEDLARGVFKGRRLRNHFFTRGDDPYRVGD